MASHSPKYFQTRKCIVCYKKATCWTGHTHVTPKRYIVLAGWCNEHGNSTSRYLNKVRGCQGCFGKWHEKYGLTMR